MPAATMAPEQSPLLAEPHTGPLGKLIDLSLEQYSGAKGMLAKNETIGKRLTPLVDWTESTTVAILKKSPIKVDSVVTAVDTRAERVVNFSSEKFQAVRATPKNTLGYVQGRLQSLRPEDAAAANPADDEPNVRSVLLTGKSAAAERLNVLLDAGEGYLKQYLPISDDEKELIVGGSKSEIRTVARRSVALTKVAAAKAAGRVLAKTSEIKERAVNVVHVDLIKYNDWLDANVKAPVSKRLKMVDEKLALSDKLARADAKLVQPVRAQVSKRVEQVDATLVQPVKQRFVMVVTTVTDTYTERVVVPRDQMIQMFREELATQQEIAKSKSGEENLTISAGLSAVVNAARARFNKEYEVRVSPALAKFLGRGKGSEADSEAEAADMVMEDEEVESYGDEDADADDLEESE